MTELATSDTQAQRTTKVSDTDQPMQVEDAVEFCTDLHHALGSAEVHYAIIHILTRRILWCSANCIDAHPALMTGAVLNADDVLMSLLTDSANTAQPLLLAPGSFLASVAYCAHNRVTLRFEKQRPSNTYLQRYVAEREKLFMMSRSVSLSEMATTLAHELNQPIGTIANLLQAVKVMMMREAEGGEPVGPVADALARASDQTRFAAGIIARVRNFTEARTPRLVSCNTTTMLRGTIDLLDWVFRSDAVDVQVKVPEPALWVSGDGILLQQVFANLLRNAVEAMQDRALSVRTIRVCIARHTDGVLITISDSGTGLEVSENDVFLPFRTTKPGGMGVGLNICRTFVEMHRGKLWLTRAEQGGCSAHVLLPEWDGPMEEAT